MTTGAPVIPETRFAVGSLTKRMVATVIARLAEAGRLCLNEPVVAYLPELGGSCWARHATLRDLLANRSRLRLRFAAGLDVHEQRLEIVVKDCVLASFSLISGLRGHVFGGRLGVGVFSDNTMARVAGSFTGATGLEPATSGVTGRYGATGYDRLRPGITA